MVAVTNPTRRDTHASEVARMTAVDVLRRVYELTDDPAGSVDAVAGAGVDLYRKSRPEVGSSE
jgi:hypothetical protein